jgi:predicted phage-related endonuclease
MHTIPKPEHASLEWLNTRHRDKQGRVIFGGSEAGALMGCSEFTSLADLCVAKLSEPTVKEPEPQMLKGIFFEDGLLRYAEKQLGMIVKTPDVMYADRRFIATLDGIAYDHGQPFAVIECKVTNAYTINSGDDLPASWVMQGHVQQWVTDLPVYFATFDKRQHLNLVLMPFNLALAESIFDTADIAGDWLDQGMIPEYVMPELRQEHIQRLFPNVQQRAITADDTLVNHIFNLETTRNQLKKLKEQEAEEMDAIAREMRDADTVTDAAGHVMLTYKQQPGRKSFDAKTFQAEHPDLYAKYQKDGAPFRVMRFGKGNR